MQGSALPLENQMRIMHMRLTSVDRMLAMHVSPEIDTNNDNQPHDQPRTSLGRQPLSFLSALLIYLVNCLRNLDMKIPQHNCATGVPRIDFDNLSLATR
jgi:hypothetical protein